MPPSDKGLLRIFAVEPELAGGVDPASAVEACDQAAQIEAICHSLNAATGWPFRYVAGSAPAGDPLIEWSAPVNPGVGAALGHLVMDRSVWVDSEISTRRIPAEGAKHLAALVAELISQRSKLERALCEREADLAAGAPIAICPRPTPHLAERLEAVLRGGAQSLRCDAAAMYLLDDDTTELKLRAQWGMGEQRLAEPARPLAGALADLEALSGHAVVLEDDVLMELWHVPEPAGAAVCVPISGPSSVLGTLWLFCHAPRKFTATETNLAEILAGRLAADLDREALIVQLQAKRQSSAKLS